MDFDEFEKRVTELLFEVAGDERKQNVLCFIDELRDDYKKDCENFIKNLYDDVCFSMIHLISMGKTVRMHFVMTGLRQHQ